MDRIPLLLRYAFFAIIAAVVCGYATATPVRIKADVWMPASGDRMEIVRRAKDFEKRIGFSETKNFLEYSEATETYPFCGFAPRDSLPYNSSDPMIEWRYSITEEECAILAGGSSFFFQAAEAIAEIGGTPVTRSMLSASIDRFLYLVFHEDCHEQFDFPLGIEEAACNVIAVKTLEAFGDEQFKTGSPERRAIREYAEWISKKSYAANLYYAELEAVTRRYERREISQKTFFRERKRILRAVERAFSWPLDSYNSVILAVDMTYTRHYPLIEAVFEALGRDLARTAVFFKDVSARIPSPGAVMEKYRLSDADSVAFIRAEEREIIELIYRKLPGLPRKF